MDLTFSAENSILISSLLLFVSVFAWKAGYKFGVPALLLFLGVGMLFGSDGLGIQFNNPSVAQFIGMLALSIILFSGGMDTKYADIKPIYKQGMVLATLGVFLTMLFTGSFVYWLTGRLFDAITLTLTESLLLAAVMSSTDSASVFSILRGKKSGLKQNLQPTLELESGSNDPMAYMLTILLIQMIQSGDVTIWSSILSFVVQMTLGALSGWALARGALWIINRFNVQNRSLYPILLLSCVFFIFAFTDRIHGNGYLAVYIAGLVIGNHKLSYKKSISTFFDGFAWLAQIVMFLTLGLLVNPSDLLPVMGVGLIVGLFLIFIGRPLSVLLCMLPFTKVTPKAKVFISWVGLRGAVPIIFATYPLLAGTPNASFIFNIVFFITIVSLLVQGTTINIIAKWLGLSKPAERGSLFELELTEGVKASTSEISVLAKMLVNGNRLMDITLPENTLVVMVKRQDTFFVPKGQTRLFEDDHLLVISDKSDELRKIYAELGIGEDSFYHKES